MHILFAFVCAQALASSTWNISKHWLLNTIAKLTANQMAGRAPMSAFVLQTHTDEEHAHNHIVLNPVNPETKRRIQNKKIHLKTLRELNDEIAIEHGLTPLAPQIPGRRAGTSEKVRRIDAYRGQSFIFDLAEKAGFARVHATNYNEYSVILSAFDI